MSGKLKHDKLVDAVKVLDLVLMVMPFVISWLLYYSGKTAAPYYRNGQVFLILLYSILYFSYCKLYGGFLVSLFRISEIIYSQALAALFSNAIIYIVLILLSKKLPSIIPLLIVFACQIALASIWAKAANEWYFRKFPPLNCIVIYDERIHIADLIESYGMKKKFKITRVITAEDCLKDMSILDETEAVFMTDVIGRGRNEILIHCVEKKIDVYTIPNIGDLIMSGARAIHLFHLPMLRVGDVSANKEFTIIKRTFDILISSLCLVICSPLILVIAIIIKMTDGGTVFYKQARLTKDGKVFYIHKLRSMKMDAEQDGVARLSTGAEDDRITPVGKFIRKCRIDEIPQFWDVLTGNMSFVGPRPERPEIAAKYCQTLPEFSLRLQVKAGLTGYAQVYGKYNTSPLDKLQMDLMYISHQSVSYDLQIIFATIKILFQPDSTEGVEAGAITAEDHNIASNGLNK